MTEAVTKEFIIKGNIDNNGKLRGSQIIYDLANEKRYYDASGTTVGLSITGEKQKQLIDSIKEAVEEKSKSKVVSQGTQGGYNKKNNKGSRRLRQKKRKTYNKSRKNI